MPSGVATPTRINPSPIVTARRTRRTATQSPTGDGNADQTRLSRQSVLNERTQRAVPNFASWARNGEPSKELALKEGEFLSRGRQGMEPAKVKQMQELLNTHGGHLKLDGDFGPRTQRALRDFQRRRGLRADGILGPETLAALQKKAPQESQTSKADTEKPKRKELDFGGTTLKRGTQNTDHVRRLQEALNRHGADLKVDGSFGSQTERAVRKFQQQRGLGVDGIVGRRTLAGLNGKKISRVPRYGRTQTQGGRTGNKLADYARRWAGRAFKPGQTKRCADFVSTMLRKSGAAPRGFRHTNAARGLARYGRGVKRNQLRPGDVVLFGNTYRRGKYTHVGIYIGGGKFVHRPTAARPVRVNSLTSGYYARKFTGGRRL